MILSVSIIIVVVTVALLIVNNEIANNEKIGGDWVGISLHPLSTDDLSTDQAQLVKESGAGWIRIDCSEGFDTTLENATDHDLNVLAILDSWMFDKSSDFTLEAWRLNVTYYVSRYADYVDAWEIWNEPANPTYPLLDLSIPSVENMRRIVQFYFSMVETASPIIRQCDPTAKIVLFGGLNLWSGSDPHLILDKDFAEQLATMRIEQYGDALSVHAYPWMEKVESWIWEKYSDSLEYYRELYPSLEIWVTETGHPVEFEREEGQARYMCDALQYFKGKVTQLFWYSLLDNAWEEKSFGLIGDGAPRLAYYELKNELDCARAFIQRQLSEAVGWVKI